MPVAAGMSLLQTQIQSALSMGNGAQQATVAQLIAAGVASVVPLGFFPPAPIPVPLAPGGMSAGATLIQNALGMGNGATLDAVSNMMAQGISVIAPTCPPGGLSVLGLQLKNAMSLGNGATINSTAALMAVAIVAYYPMGGAI